MNPTSLLQELLEISIQLGRLQSDVDALESYNNQQSILLDGVITDMSNLMKGK